MRLLLITNDFPNPYQPTKAVFNLQLARALAQKHEIRVISPIAWTDELGAKRARRCLLPRSRQVVLDGVAVAHPTYYFPPKLFRSHYGWFFWLSLRRTMRRLLTSYRPDVVLGYWAHPDGEAAVRAARAVGVPSAVLVGGSDVLLLPQTPDRRRCVAKVLQATDVVITVNEHLRSRVLELGVAPANIHVWYQGVDTTRFTPGDRAAARGRLGIPADGRVLLWVGRMVPVKGLDVLLQACARLRDRGVEFHLHLVGDGPLRPSLQAESESRGLSGRVSFAGSVVHEQLPDWYRAADLTLLPSRSEGLPNVLRESLACGTPFVASRVGGIPEIAGGPLNRLVPPEDPGALAEAIAGALSGRLGDGRPLIRAADWEESAEALVEILRPHVSRPVDGAAARRPALPGRATHV
jgi:teichuronic acid biosynthesis glycosyltransferase TuaC